MEPINSGLSMLLGDNIDVKYSGGHPLFIKCYSRKAFLETDRKDEAYKQGVTILCFLVMALKLVFREGIHIEFNFIQGKAFWKQIGHT